MRFFHFVPIIAVTALIRYSASNQQVSRTPTWTLYIDAMYGVCIRHDDAVFSVKLTTLSRCFTVQRDYLGCDSSKQIVDTLLIGVNVASAFEAPCGPIFLSNNTDTFLETIQWRIKVHRELYLNLTFSEFALPEPYARCDRYQGSEIFVVGHENVTLNLNHKDSVFLCGEYSPFSMVWRYSRVLLVYTRKTSTTQVGHFRIQYQVCHQKAKTRKVQTINHVLTWQPHSFNQLKLSTLSSFESGPRHVMYTVHVIGSRLTLLDVMFMLQGTSEQHFYIEAFDGPGPAELHRRFVEHEVLHSKWIEFDTFQAYLQITCERNHCDGLFIKYKWPSALPFSYPVMLLKGFTLTNSVVTEICSYGHHWYCLFEVGTRVLHNVEISLQVVNFHGPDYLGGFIKPQNCLLAGVTITDGYRETFMSNSNSLFKYLGHIPRSLAVDSVLPEITTCFDVPLSAENKVVWNFPLNTFVSYGPTLILAIYAYGAYVDLSKSEIKLVMRPSYSAGLIVSCPSIHADGYLGIGTVSLSGHASISHGKQWNCPLGNMLTIKITNLVAEESLTPTSDVIICTNHQQQMTTVMIAPHLSEQFSAGAVRSLFVQMNTQLAEIKMDCHVTIADALEVLAIDFSLYTQVPKVVGGLGYSVAATSLTSGRRFFGKRERLIGRYVRLHLFMRTTYVPVKLNATLFCTEAVQLFEASDKELERHLQQAQKTSRCQNYMIPLWNNSKHYNNSNNNTYVIYLSTPHHLMWLKSTIKSRGRFGKLSLLHFDWYFSKYLFIAHIKLYGICNQLCHNAKIQIAYKAMVSHNIVLLEWNLLLTPSAFKIALSDIPRSGALLYITSPNDECLEHLCSATIDIEDNAKDNHRLSIWDGSDSEQPPFINYHLLWTHEEYTWNEAEDICQQLDGMHVTSIATQMEYLLISRMLLGSAYYVSNTDNFRLPSLSPCLTGSSLCIIYIGLRTQNASFSWIDGRPTGYLRWNVNYFTDHGVNSVKYYSQNNGRENPNIEQLLMEARSILQPPYTGETLCSVLIGSPGPLDMEFVSIPCDRKLKVSGIMCIRGGNEPKRKEPLYRLTHLKVKAKDSQLVANTSNNGFNVDTLYEALFQGKNPPENQGSSSLSFYYETLNEEEYSKAYGIKSQQLQQRWTETIQNCSNLGHNISLCNILWPYNETSTNKLQNLTTDLFLFKPDQNNENTRLSIQFLNGSMIASNYCRSEGVFDGKQCIHVLQKPPDNKSLNLDQICQKYLNESHTYVYSIASDLLTLSSILQKLDISSGQASCYNKLGNTVVLHLDAGKLEPRLNEQVDSATKYVVCSMQPIQPTCPPAYITCGSVCISEQFMCDGKVDCKSGQDEQNCTHLCGALKPSPIHCRTKCHLKTCICHELYFQCSSGGCIHSSKVCNGHADCVNAEDETLCFGLMSTPSEIDTKNDFIPDQEDSSDEKIYINLLKSGRKEVAETCGSVHQAPCMKGHPACYSINKMCLYDHMEDGRLKYCRNGLHLLDCEHFHCSGSFKCQHSYCVPTHKVCNGVQDCPYGDDEVMCPVSTCINMLQCGQICVHPSAICDGSLQCESGEDELACGAPKCPPVCQCSGYAMKCNLSIVLDASFNRLTMYILRHPKPILIKGVFKHVSSLLFLDISYCNITSISTRGPFFELHALVKLNLSHNSISSLAHGSLDGLSNLIQLDMSWNPLSSLEPQAFAYMGKLRKLFLKHCHLDVVSDIAVPSAQSLDTFDMSFGGRINIGCLSLRVAVFDLTNTTIQYDKDYSDRCWKNVNQVISDQKGICCLGLFKGKCFNGWESRHQTCTSLFSSRILLVYCYFLVITIVICNSCVFVYKLLMPSSDTLLVCNLALADSFIVVPLCILINWHALYDTEFPFFEPFISRSVRCRIFGDILIVFTQMATFFQMLITLQKYYGIVRACNIVSEYKPPIYLVISAAWLASTSVCAFFRFQDVNEAPTTTLLEGFFYHYCYKNPLWLVFSILTIIFALAATFSYGQILKNIHETRMKQVGLKHGKDNVLSSMIRVTAILIISNVSVLAAICLTVWLCLTTTMAPQAVALLVLIFPLPSLFNPLLFTLSTRRFVRDCIHCVSPVIQRLERTMLRR